jgi:chromosome segregation ATPase
LDRPPDKEGLQHVAAAKSVYKEAVEKAVQNFPPGTSSPPQGLTQRTNTSHNNSTPLHSIDEVSNMGGKTAVVEDSSTKGKQRRPVGLTKTNTGDKDKDWMGNKLDQGQTKILFLKDDNSNEGEIIKSNKQKSNELSPIRESLEDLIEANPMGEDIANTLHDHSRQLNAMLASINEMDKSFDIDSLRDTRENMEQATAAATSKLEDVNANMKQLDEDVADIGRMRSDLEELLAKSNAELAQLKSEKADGIDKFQSSVDQVQGMTEALGRTRDQWNKSLTKTQEQWEGTFDALGTKQQDAFDDALSKMQATIATMEAQATNLQNGIDQVKTLQEASENHTATIDSTVSSITENSNKLIQQKVVALTEATSQKPELTVFGRFLRSSNLQTRN